MPGPLLTGQMGVVLPPGGKTPGTSQLGSLSLGGPGPYAVPLSLPALAQAQALPFIGHLYTTGMVFKKSLGPLLNRPMLKWTLNAGHHPVQLDLPSNFGKAYSDQVASLNPLAWWRLGDPTTAMADSSGHGFGATASADVALSQMRPVPDGDRAVGFNGIKGRVVTPTIPANLLTGAMTFEAWVKVALETRPLITTGSYEQVATRFAPGFDPNLVVYTIIGVFANLGLTLHGSGSVFAVKAWLAGNSTPYGSVSPGFWHHIVGVYAGFGSSSRTIWLDGQLIGVEATGSAGDNTAAMRIGEDERSTGYDTTPNGQIDEAAIYAYALTPAQIMANYNAALVPPSPTQGDVIELTEQGGDGKVVYTGLVNDVLENLDAKPPYVSVMLDPLVTELGEAFFDHNYTTYTDIAQMARDCVNATAHLTYTPQSIPDTGVFAKFNFHFTSPLEVMNTIKHIGGPNFFFYVDELGVVWFQAVTLTGRPYLTLPQGGVFSVRKKSSPLNTLKNYIVVGGGLAEQTADGAALFAIYNNKASQKKYGLRALTPPLFFPAAVDQGTLNSLRDAIGAAMDQIRPKVQITLPAYGKRILLGRHGGPSIRYWEPAVFPMTETLDGSDASQNAGEYSPTYVILDVEMDGPNQTLVLGPLPVTADDFKYALDGTVARMTHQLMLYPPLSTNHYGILNLGTLGSQ